jgi:lipopolysaccharide export system permease protein
VRDKEGHNVFVAANTPNGQTVTSAQTGRVETLSDVRYLMLMEGQRLEIRRDDQRLRISEFKQYGSQVGSQQVVTVTPVPKSISSWQLVLQPTADHLAELAWRIGLGLAGFNMVLIALAMARINPRGARNGHLITAFFTFIVYYNLINLGQSWISAGRISFGALLLLLHGGAFAIALGLLWVRDRQWSVSTWWPRSASPAPANGGAA